ncbi:BrnT family toxin [Duganella radicis]|uniref:BrnT family toxin n=1 Tax=Duganella radicis TaxID=551988 RepID=A0A6L6PIH8_9BURK|nr:BrnT family toxin [Duganella radicis]
MVITFDPKKDKLNRRKHGVSLSAAAGLDWADAVIWTDRSRKYLASLVCAGPECRRKYVMYHKERKIIFCTPEEDAIITAAALSDPDAQR